MAEETQVVQRAEKVRGKNLQGKEMVLDKTQPQQLVLFQTFFPDDDAADKYSNTIELYDAMPKYFSNPKIMDAMRKDGTYLPTLERVFRHRQETYTVHIRPARLKGHTGVEKEYYPSPREELVEDALRKIACDQVKGMYLDNLAGVQFTLYGLKKELKSRGHDIELRTLIDALTICHRATMSLIGSNGRVILDASIFPVLLLGSKQDWMKHPQETRCYVQFHPLVTQCIGQLTYRQFDYSAAISYTHRLARWLHKRLAHNYPQAGLINPYTIRLSTILRDSGTYQSPRSHENSRRVDEALEELTDHHILLEVTRDVQRGPRNSIVDITYTLRPTPEFVAEVKKANRRVTTLTHLLPPSQTHRVE
jgi:hypothetical protein